MSDDTGPMTAEGAESVALADPAEAAAVLRQLLAAVAEGQLEAKVPAGGRTLRRIEGGRRPRGRYLRPRRPVAFPGDSFPRSPGPITRGRSVAVVRSGSDR